MQPVKPVQQPQQQDQDIVGYVAVDQNGECKAFSTRRDFDFKLEVKGKVVESEYQQRVDLSLPVRKGSTDLD